jgi:hypothetical protein
VKFVFLLFIPNFGARNGLDTLRIAQYLTWVKAGFSTSGDFS